MSKFPKTRFVKITVSYIYLFLDVLPEYLSILITDFSKLIEFKSYSPKIFKNSDLKKIVKVYIFKF